MNNKPLNITYNKIIFYISILFLALFVTSCAEPKIDENKQELQSPTQKLTKHNNILKDLGKMYRAFYGRNTEIYIQSKPISDNTGAGGLPADLSRMVISAVNKIGKPIIYVPYDPSYFLNEYKTGADGVINRKLPKYVIAGAITEYDVGTSSNSDSANVDVYIPMNSKVQADGSAGKNNTTTASKLTLDMQMLTYQTQAMISDAQAINTITVFEQSKSRSLGFSIFGSCIGIDGSVSRKQGTHAALRLLVEASVFEILAKEAKLPYWKILNSKVDEEMVDSMYEYYSSKDTKSLLIELQSKLLPSYKFNIKSIGILDNETKRALKILSNDLGIQDPLNINANLLTKIWFNIPYKRTDKYYGHINLSNSNEPQIKNTFKQKDNDYSHTAKSLASSLIALISEDRATYKIETFVDKNTHVRNDISTKFRDEFITALKSNPKNLKIDYELRAIKREIVKNRAFHNNDDNDVYLVKGYLSKSHNNIIAEIHLIDKSGKIRKRLDESFEGTNKNQTDTLGLGLLVESAGIKTEMKNNVVVFSTDKGNENPVYFKDEIIVFNLNVEKPLYVHVYNIDKDGNANLLEEGQKLLKPNINYTIPEKNSGWQLVTQAPFGREVIKVFASEKYIPFPNTKNKSESVVEQLRSFASNNNIKYYEQSILLETRK